MIGLSALLVFLLGVLELVVIIKVGAAIGAIEAVALLIGVTIVGVWLVKREGLAVLRRARRDADEGRMPTASLLDGMILLVAGALLIFPGFLTDIVAVFLLLPPVRALVRRRPGGPLRAPDVGRDGPGRHVPPTGPPMGFGRPTAEPTDGWSTRSRTCGPRAATSHPTATTLPPSPDRPEPESPARAGRPPNGGGPSGRRDASPRDYDDAVGNAASMADTRRAEHPPMLDGGDGFLHDQTGEAAELLRRRSVADHDRLAGVPAGGHGWPRAAPGR